MNSNQQFATAIKPTPLLNTPCFSETFTTLPFDEQHLLRAVEMVALPGTKFRILATTHHPHILQVTTLEYPYDGEFFVDGRFLKLTIEEPLERSKRLPLPCQIKQRLDEMLGCPYVWGGNWPAGIPQLSEYYPCAFYDPRIVHIHLLGGVDCTGMLYYATDGWTPRNTSRLVSWGQSVAIGGLVIDELIATLQPFDLLVWKGHVVCVYDQCHAIESLLGKGVIKTPLRGRLEEILRTRTPADEARDDTFVVRRWIDLA